jgi:hypothetical protein
MEQWNAAAIKKHMVSANYRFSQTIKGMNPRASSGLKRKLASLAALTPQQSCEEFFD